MRKHPAMSAAGRTVLTVALAAGALPAGALPAYALPADALPSGAPPAAAARAPGGTSVGVPARFAHQVLDWSACAGIANDRLRCARVRVPLDYTHPGGRTISIAISRLPATDPALRRGALFTTGGGPGGPGVPLPDQLGRQLDPDILARYDLVGFDPRFVERSTPVTCGQPAEEPGGYWLRVDGYQARADTVRQARGYARDCARHAGWALPFATTANVARDMDVIRAVLGEPRISYLAGSYAAMVGSVYATLFPGRVDRFVLDSPPDPGTVWRPFELDRTAGMQAGYEAFTGWLADRDGTYHLGTTPAAVGAALTAILRAAAVQPLVAGGHAYTMGELGYLALLALFAEGLRPVVAADILAVAGGSPPPVPLDLRPSPLPGTPRVPADNHTAANMAYRCGDGPWPRDPAAYRADLIRYEAAYPVYGAATANIAPCAFWPTARDNRVPLTGSRSPGVLVVAALGDAAVPLSNSVATASAIHGSRLVTVDLRVHVPFISGQAGPCVTGAVNRYLCTGALPDRDLAC